MRAVLLVWPAYGRRYATAAEARKDFKDGKDFSCSRQGGPYMSIRDFKADSMTHFDGVKIVQNLPVLTTYVLKEECNAQ